MDEPEKLPSCKNCGTEFNPYRYWQEFCCPPCRTQYYERYVRHPFSRALKELDEEEKDEIDELDEEVAKRKNRGGR